LTSVSIPNGTSLVNGTFRGCKNLVTVNIPSTEDWLSNRVFEGCAFTSIVIPNTITNIGDLAFANTKLTSIDIPDSVEVIGNQVFRGCEGLTYVYIPDSAYFLGEFAFFDCKNLENVSLPNTLYWFSFNTFHFFSKSIFFSEDKVANPIKDENNADRKCAIL
jgi:hypothetical protein